MADPSSSKSIKAARFGRAMFPLAAPAALRSPAQPAMPVYSVQTPKLRADEPASRKTETNLRSSRAFGIVQEQQRSVQLDSQIRTEAARQRTAAKYGNRDAEDEVKSPSNLKTSGQAATKRTVVMVPTIQPPPALLKKKPGALGSSIRKTQAPDPDAESLQFDDYVDYPEPIAPEERISVSEQGGAVGNMLQKLKGKPVNRGMTMYPITPIPARDPAPRRAIKGPLPFSESAPQSSYLYQSGYENQGGYDQGYTADGYNKGGSEDYRRDDGSSSSLPPPTSTTQMFGPPPNAGRIPKPAFAQTYGVLYPAQTPQRLPRMGPAVVAPSSEPRAIRRSPAPVEQPVVRTAPRGVAGRPTAPAAYDIVDNRSSAEKKNPPPVPKKQFMSDDDSKMDPSRKGIKATKSMGRESNEPPEPRRVFSGAKPTPFAATAGGALVAMRNAVMSSPAPVQPQYEPEPEPPEPEQEPEAPPTPPANDDDEAALDVDTETYIAGLFENAIIADQLSPEVFVENDLTLANAGSMAFYRFLDVASFFSQVGSIRLRYAQLDDNFAQALYEFMSDRRFPFLEVVDLEGNYLSMQGMVTVIATMNIGYGEPANEPEDQRKDSGDLIPYQCAIVELNLLNQQTKMGMDALGEFEQFVAEVFEKNSSILKFSYKFTNPEVSKFVNQLLIRNAALIRIALEESEFDRSMSISGGEAAPIVPEPIETETVQWIKKAISSGMDSDVAFIDEQEFRESVSPDIFYAFARKLGGSTSVQSIQLVGVDLSDKFVLEFIDGLKSLKSPSKVLRDLVLDYNQISGSVVLLLIQALENTSSIREFSAIGQDTSNPLTQDQDQSFLQSIDRNTSITNVKVDFAIPTSARQVLKFTSRNAKSLKQAGLS